MTPEGRVKDKVKKVLDRFVHYREMPVPSGFGKSGLDFTVCFFGHFITIETKKPGDVLTPRQDLRRRDIQAAGGIVYGVDGTETPGEGMTPWSKFVSELEYIANDPGSCQLAA
jgi:hypothetical protein